MLRSWDPWTKGSEVALEESTTEIKLVLNAFDSVLKNICGLKWNWPICVSYKHRGSCQKPTFLEYPIPEIPDDSEKKIGYGLGIAKNYWVGSDIEYPGDRIWKFSSLGGLKTPPTKTSNTTPNYFPKYVFTPLWNEPHLFLNQIPVNLELEEPSPNNIELEAS